MSYGNDWQATLRPGILITSKAVKEGGTLGCFARLSNDATKIMILSNSHVLYGDVVSLGSSGDGVEIGQPATTCCLCCTCRVIAENFRAPPVTMVSVTVTSPAEFAGTYQGSEIDCAIAKINQKRPFTNEALYGMIKGTPSSGLGVSGGDAVEMVGTSSGHSKGRVLQFTTVATYAGGASISNILYPFPSLSGAIEENMGGTFPNINQLVICPDPDPDDASRVTHFCTFGDSGAVVVNQAKLVIGIVTRMRRITPEVRTEVNKILATPLPQHAGTLGLVTPIGPALTALGITIDPDMKTTASSAGDSIEDLQQAEAERESELALQLTLRDLEAEVRSKALGAAAMTALDRHRPEVLQLVNTQRQVAVTWRRNGGPAFAAHCLHSIRDHEYAIPESVEGVTPLMLMEKMASVLRRYGSAHLRADIDAYETLAYEWVEGCTSIWQLVERMRRLERVKAGPFASAVSAS
jgi:hypothetical protein